MTENKKLVPPFVHFEPAVVNHELGVHVTWNALTLIKNNDNGTLSCFMPGYDIYFSASTIEKMKEKTGFLSKMFIDHFLMHQKNGIKKLVLELHKLGFKSNNDNDTIHKLINNKIIRAKFKTDLKNIPKVFQDTPSFSHESTLEISS